MPAIKEKFRSHASNPRRRTTLRKKNDKVFNDAQIIELIEAYQTMGKMLEQLVGREFFYRPQFLKGLESVLQDVAAGRTQEVKTFEDFVN